MVSTAVSAATQRAVFLDHGLPRRTNIESLPRDDPVAGENQPFVARRG